MGKFDKYLIVTDLDGTLQWYMESPSERNKEAIRYFTENGGKFAISTGRNPEYGLPCFDGLCINTPCSFGNGSILTDLSTRKHLVVKTLQGDMWFDFVKYCVDLLPEIYMEIHTVDKCYVISHNKSRGDFPPRENAVFTTVDAIKDEEWVKFFTLSGKEYQKTIEETAKKFGIDKVSNSFRAAEMVYEFVDKSANKGEMLKILAELPENKGRTVIACGDYPNDISMLQTADIGIAAGNAHPDVKAAADRVGCHCKEDLLAEVIYSLE